MLNIREQCHAILKGSVTLYLKEQCHVILKGIVLRYT